ncbi:unnamed protein product [Protopolystoma xenopodis]|uniref:Uncharacterized protein n=1 Tax=Protopolystoma xenopodis TaxID=117903 RepID=A0A3S5ALS3_9PLAT|nr:unnamed protein product [Protopolystoma xenopodis]
MPGLEKVAGLKNIARSIEPRRRRRRQTLTHSSLDRPLPDHDVTTLQRRCHKLACPQSGRMARLFPVDLPLELGPSTSSRATLTHLEGPLGLFSSFAQLI